MTEPTGTARPANESIVSALRGEILTMQLAPGDLLSEPEIGKRYGASRTPVREAFAQLRDEGLVETFPSRGTFVTRLSTERIRGAQFLREAVEVAVVERLCTKGIPQPIRASLDDNLAQQRAAVSDADVTLFLALDDDFHGLLAKATGLQRVGPVLRREKVWLDRVRAFTVTDPAHCQPLLKEHEALLQGIVGGWTVSAVGQIRTHLRQVLTSLDDLAREQSHVFEDAP